MIQAENFTERVFNDEFKGKKYKCGRYAISSVNILHLIIMDMERKRHTLNKEYRV